MFESWVWIAHKFIGKTWSPRFHRRLGDTAGLGAWPRMAVHGAGRDPGGSYLGRGDISLWCRGGDSRHLRQKRRGESCGELQGQTYWRINIIFELSWQKYKEAPRPPAGMIFVLGFEMSILQHITTYYIYNYYIIYSTIVLLWHIN